MNGPNYLKMMDLGWLHYQDLVSKYIQDSFDEEIRSASKRLANENLKKLPSEFLPDGESQLEIDTLKTVFQECYQQALQLEIALDDVAVKHIESISRLSRLFGKPIMFDQLRFKKEIMNWFWNGRPSRTPLQAIVKLLAYSPLGLSSSKQDGIRPLKVDSETETEPAIWIFDVHHEFELWCKALIEAMEDEAKHGIRPDQDVVRAIVSVFPNLDGIVDRSVPTQSPPEAGPGQRPPGIGGR